ncbi:MAG TPA: hypothetical protein VIG24_11910, partial [Acidimicrobiia bacterium]
VWVWLVKPGTSRRPTDFDRLPPGRESTWNSGVPTNLRPEMEWSTRSNRRRSVGSYRARLEYELG